MMTFRDRRPGAHGGAPVPSGTDQPVNGAGSHVSDPGVPYSRIPKRIPGTAPPASSADMMIWPTTTPLPLS